MHKFCNKCHKEIPLPDMLKHGNVKIGGKIVLKCGAYRCTGEAVIQGSKLEETKKESWPQEQSQMEGETGLQLAHG